MREVLLGPFAIAALVLGLAGAGKLRSPDAAARAAIVLGWPFGRLRVRVLATAELALAVWSLAGPGVASAAALATTYAGFAAIAFALGGRQAACGCFGADDAPASPGHWVLSASLAVLCGAAALWPPHPLAWALTRHPGLAAVLAVGVAGAAYGVVVAYTQLSTAWGAWSGR